MTFQSLQISYAAYPRGTNKCIFVLVSLVHLCNNTGKLEPPLIFDS